MGRMNREKGVYELLEAFNRLVKDNEDAKLLLIGSNEGIPEDIFSSYSNISYGENLICYGYTKTPYIALQAGDVLCLPSYREGFGISVIEASAITLPVIVSDIYGLRDAFEDGRTGLKCKPRDADSLYEVMKTLYDDKDMRVSLGKAGRERTKQMFSMDLVSNAWVDYFKANIQ
jgi:glycosyltransferase involved in cell wall biosynthesis